jgi:hypothetical protein
MRTFFSVVALLGLIACNDHQKAPDDAPLAPASAPRAETARTVLSGTIRVDDALKEKIPANGTLFIIARPEGAAAGPPALVKRVAGVTFPYNFVLDSDNVMMGGPVPEKLTVSARLDQDGDAMSKSPGDLTGASKSAAAQGAKDVELVLSDVIAANP